MLIIHRGVPLEDYPLGFALRLPRSPSAVVSDSADPNVRARTITSLQHPNIIFLLCLAHTFALTCGDYITSSSHHAFMAQSQRVVHFSTSAPRCGCRCFVPKSREPSANRCPFFLAVATRWTSTWLSAVSVLQVCNALRSAFTSAEGKEQVLDAMTSRSVKYKNLKDVIEIVRSQTFFEDLGEHLDALLPCARAAPSPWPM
jgi:hypothetical protein